jgi:hypothetical protein
MLFADTQTFNAVGPFTNWNTGTWYDIYFHFDLTGVDIDKIKSAKLRIWVQDSEQTNNNAVFNGNIVGQLRTDMELSEFDIMPSEFSNTGDNEAVVDIGYEGGAEWLLVYASELVINTGGSGGEKAEAEEEVWERNHEMQCWQVWINEDNAFEVKHLNAVQ